MKKNMSPADRIIRTIIAAIIAFLFMNGTISGVTALVLLALAIIFLITALTGFCPLYSLFNLSTKKNNS